MLILPSGYANPIPDCESTEKAIKQVKDMFQNNLSAQLALLRVTAPIAVMKVRASTTTSTVRSTP